MGSLFKRLALSLFLAVCLLGVANVVFADTPANEVSAVGVSTDISSSSVSSGQYGAWLTNSSSGVTGSISSVIVNYDLVQGDSVSLLFWSYNSSASGAYHQIGSEEIVPVTGPFSGGQSFQVPSSVNGSPVDGVTLQVNCGSGSGVRYAYFSYAYVSGAPDLDFAGYSPPASNVYVMNWGIPPSLAVGVVPAVPSVPAVPGQVQEGGQGNAVSVAVPVESIPASVPSPSALPSMPSPDSALPPHSAPVPAQPVLVQSPVQNVSSSQSVGPVLSLSPVGSVSPVLGVIGPNHVTGPTTTQSWSVQSMAQVNLYGITQ